MKQKAVVVFQIPQRKFSVGLEIPLDITAKELVAALNAAYELGIDTSDIKNCYLQAENPIALLRGNRILEEFGLRSGSVIYYTGQGETYGE